jgi:hypothetical protein
VDDFGPPAVLSKKYDFMEVFFQLKGYVPKLKKDFILYRSFKDFNHDFFLNDLQSVN